MTMTPQIAQIKEAVNRRYAQSIAAGDLVTTGGVYNCRKMRGKAGLPDGYSEHSWGNAWDLYYRGNRALVDNVVEWLRAEDAAGRLPVGSIITYGASGSHVHIEGSPKRNPRPYNQIPPCADALAPPTGEDEEAMTLDIQQALNDAGIPDYERRPLVLDGKWGPRTASAFALMAALAAQSLPQSSAGGSFTITGTVELAPEG